MCSSIKKMSSMNRTERGIWFKIKKEVEEERRREYVEKCIRVDCEDYRDLFLNEERELYRELDLKRKRVEDNMNDEFLKMIIEGILQEISENTNVEINVLENIRKNQAKL